MDHMRKMAAMKKSAILLAFFVLAALPAAAQHNEFGVLFGSTRSMKSAVGKGRFDSGMREIYYGVELEPGTWFRVELGRMTTRTAFPTDQLDAAGHRIFDVDQHGTIEHADGIVEYRFDEAFGHTGLFAGGGLYRQKGNSRSQSDYGLQVGLNAIFPLSRTWGIVAEGAYHWTHFFTPKPRYVTLGAGLHITF